MSDTKKIQRVRRRGRKAGDGVLKEIESQTSLLEKASKLRYGRHSCPPVERVVQTWRRILRANPDLKKILAEERIGDAKSGRENKCVEAIQSCEKQWLKVPWLHDESQWLLRRVMAAIATDDADWFRKMAKVIEVGAGQSAYPLHEAVLDLVIFPTTVVNGRIVIYHLPENQTPRYNIEQVCSLLEAKGMKTANQSSRDWRRTVRRACHEVGLALLPAKRGPKSKRS